MIDKIDQQFKEALKSKDEITVSALRNLKAELANVEIEKKAKLTEQEILSVVARKVKQHKDSIEGFKAGGRNDLVETEQKQMEVLQKYLPEQLSEDEVRGLVKETITASGATANDFGKVMKEVLGKAQGRTDGGVVSRMVKEELGK